MWRIAAALLLAAIHAFFIYRISAFRVDRKWHQGYFGPVIESLSGLSHLREANYTAEGRKYWPWLIGSFWLMLFGNLALLVSWYRA